jgi:hypothetical protein
MEPTRQLDRPPEATIIAIRPGLRISETCFQVGRQHFALSALDNVHTRQAARDPLTRRAGAMAIGGVLLLGVFAPLMHPAGIVASLAVLFGLAMLTAVSSRQRPRRLELWANYHGHPSQLFVSDDWWLFGGVERQLKRVLAESKTGYVVALQPPTTHGVPHPSNMHPSTMHPGGSRAGFERAA